MDKCECSLRIKLVGDGCRYCQPQTYIDNMHTAMEVDSLEITELEATAAIYKQQLSDMAMEVERLRDEVDLDAVAIADNNAQLRRQLATANAEIERQRARGGRFWEAIVAAGKLNAESQAELERVKKDALAMRKSLIKWRERQWPNSDQSVIIDHEFPAIAAMSAMKEGGK